MRQSVIFIIIFCLAFPLKAQFAIINDPDGYTYVREKPNGDARIIHKINDNEVFVYGYFDDIDSDWSTVYIPKNRFGIGCEESPFIKGFIHKSRLMPIDSLTEPPRSRIIFEYRVDTFDSANHIIDYHKDGRINSIDGISYHGILPRLQVIELKVIIENKTLLIPEVFYQDLFRKPGTVFINQKDDLYFISNFNGHADGYLLLWVIDSTGVKQRIKMTP